MSGIKDSKFKILIIIIICFVVLINVALTIMRIINGMQQQIEDINGESKELAQITDATIESIYHDYQIYGKHHSGNGEKSGIENIKKFSKKYEIQDHQDTEFTAKKLSGIYVLNAYLGTGKNITFNIDSEVKSGNLKLVITDDTNKILHTVPIDKSAIITIFAEKDRVYFVKCIGESAEVSVNITRTVES